MVPVVTERPAPCREHPHRYTVHRCERCRQPLCADCLTPTARAPDGTRRWYCAICHRALADEQAARRRPTAPPTLSVRLATLGRVVRVIALALLVVPVALAGVAGAFWLQGVTGAGPRGAAEPTCGELTRIQTIGAIGAQGIGTGEAVNLLAYPHRARVEVVQPAPGSQVARGLPGSAAPAASSGIAGPAGLPASPALVAPGAPGALVDECDGGWHSAPETRLPVELVITPVREGPTYIHRIALQQDPTAPRASWVKDFVLLVSASDSGDDFKPLRLDRAPQLIADTQPQWFQLVQPAPAGQVPPEQLAPQERLRYAQNFPEVLPVRRLLLRILSTHGGLAAAGRSDGTPASVSASAPAISLGEIAVYGPDLELTIDDETSTDGTWTGYYRFSPNQLRPYAGRPFAVLITNRSRHVHTFTTTRQQTNVNVRLEPGQVTAVQFIAASVVGQYQFLCTMRGHDRIGLSGTIHVR